jgi:FkbM family methyltransferase
LAVIQKVVMLAPVVKKFIPGSLWSLASKLKHEIFGSRRYFSTFPLPTAIRLIGSKLKLRKSRSGALVEFRVSGRVCPVLRAKTHDIDIFEYNFLLGNKVKLRIEPRFIVDAGAHIGCSALFLASSFPRANIIAIEANPRNYQLLVRNTRDCRRIRAINAAVWNRREPVVIANEQDDPWGYRIKPAEGQFTTIDGLTISAIMSQCGLKEIDLLKLDIEGAEKEIFDAADLDWMHRTHAIMIELHDWFRPGCEPAFLDAARRFGFAITQRSSHNIIVAEQLSAPPHDDNSLVTGLADESSSMTSP